VNIPFECKSGSVMIDVSAYIVNFLAFLRYLSIEKGQTVLFFLSKWLLTRGALCPLPIGRVASTSTIALK
jgi:hypothetical protein